MGFVNLEKGEERKTGLTELPAAVQKTINDNLGGGTVTERNLGN
jgi:hypothetical protein